MRQSSAQTTNFAFALDVPDARSFKFSNTPPQEPGTTFQPLYCPLVFSAESSASTTSEQVEALPSVKAAAKL
jgi:hypothetical protein